MSDAKRYDVTEKYIGTGEYVGAMEESATGDWVAFSDYDARKARLADALEAQAREIGLLDAAYNKEIRLRVELESRLAAAECERARLKAEWDAAYEQAMQNGAAANEAKARLEEAERFIADAYEWWKEGASWDASDYRASGIPQRHKALLRAAESHGDAIEKDGLQGWLPKGYHMRGRG